MIIEWSALENISNYSVSIYSTASPGLTELKNECDEINKNSENEKFSCEMKNLEPDSPYKFLVIGLESVFFFTDEATLVTSTLPIAPKITIMVSKISSTTAEFEISLSHHFDRDSDFKRQLTSLDDNREEISLICESPEFCRAFNLQALTSYNIRVTGKTDRTVSTLRKLFIFSA